MLCIRCASAFFLPFLNSAKMIHLSETAALLQPILKNSKMRHLKAQNKKAAEMIHLIQSLQGQ